MTIDEIKQVQDIQGTAGFRVIQSVIDKHIRILDSVSDIDGRSETRAGIQALAKNKAVECLKTIRNEINVSDVSKRDTNQTYE